MSEGVEPVTQPVNTSMRAAAARRVPTSDRLLSDNASRTLVAELLDGWFAAFGWAAGLLVGAIVGVVVVKERCSLLRGPREEDAA